ncbi:MAG: capsule biosynthesis protein [Ruegeria sp.]
MNIPPLNDCERAFLFLQGPHGPFFNSLGQMLRAAGAKVWRVGFNAGDRAFWPDRPSYIPFRGSPDDWPAKLTELTQQLLVTDIVLYGDTRPVHKQAVEVANKLGITVHVFEEGYLRPWWVTYERGGSNGNSRLMDLSVKQMQLALDQSELDTPPPPTHWGDMRQHVFYGALYHWFVLFLNHSYKSFRPHRKLRASQEFRLYLKSLFLMPFHRVQRSLATAKIRRDGYPYHLALLQLSHDSSVQFHSNYSCNTEFLEHVISGFARGAPSHHHLVLKEHPLENHQIPLRRRARRIASDHGVESRVHYVPGGKLAKLLNEARSAVTINSTAGQQVLWRGTPLRVFGNSVYSKSEFISQQSIEAFFAKPTLPDTKAYRAYRTFLLETSQIPGGFYSRRGRQQLLRKVVDMMLSKQDPYQVILAGKETNTPQLRIVQ